MKTFRPAEIRNFALVGHATSGKTTLAEAMLYCGGAVHRLGSVAQGTTVSDYHVGEQQRHISVHGTLLNCEWRGGSSTLSIRPATSISAAKASTRCVSRTLQSW
jgi:elongation factor G